MKQNNVMSTENTGGQAFPTRGEYGSDYGGLTKREYFAAMAMQGLLANTGGVSGEKGQTWYEKTADESLELADALISQLSKSNL